MKNTNDEIKHLQMKVKQLQMDNKKLTVENEFVKKLSALVYQEKDQKH